ncbi:hypothetical protein LJC18_05160 [Lachnospiraceae bacterium OttesenSCG-928-E19]|nr:hypothetical protein [Lachnospiraceae bacterium OttesenSCG-928-E19]
MKNLIKKMFMFTSILGVVAIMGGCSSNSSKNKNQDRPHDVEYYQTHQDADVTRVSARMYTHSRDGGESRMGHIKFHETNAGLQMMVELKDMRPGVEYQVHVYDWECNDNVTKCKKEKAVSGLPMLRAGNDGKLEETFLIRGVTAKQLKKSMITMERDGGYKAAWGKLN